MRILYINAMGPAEKTPMGGIFVSQRIRCLQEMGKDVVPVNLDIRYDAAARKLLHMPDRGRGITRQAGVTYRWEKIVYSLPEVAVSSVWPGVFDARISGMLRRKEYLKDTDLIHLHWFWPAGGGIARAAAAEGKPYVITCHGSEINVLMKSRRNRKRMIRILEGASRVIFVSRALKQTALELGYSGKNAAVIHNGIDTGVFHTEPGHRQTRGRKVIGFVGNLLPVKGADRLPAIFEAVYADDPDSEFFVVGDGPLRHELEQSMAALPVTFTGVLKPEKLAEIYRKMDYLVAPSRSEGFPCVLKEAQACGVIPIANRVGGVPEAVGKNGILIDGSGEEKTFGTLYSEAIRRIKDGEVLLDPDLIAEEGKKNSWENQVAEELELYREIIRV